jgi:hypothetical protein
MEIIIGLVILAGIAWFFFMRDKKTEVAVPYKVEAPAPVVEVVPAGTEATMSASAPEATKPAKAPAKPKAAAKPKAPAKTAEKAPAKSKAPAKTAKPKVTVAK